MRWLVLPLFAVLLTPTRVEASGCSLGPFTTTYDPSLDCEVVIYEHPGQVTPPPLVVYAKRGQELVSLDASTTTTTAPLEVRYTNYACDGSILHDSTAVEDYVVSRVTLTGAQVGDELTINGAIVGTVTAAGTCMEDMSRLVPFCSGLNSGVPCPIDPDDDGSEDAADDGTGCSATHRSPSLALVLLALTRLRRRRR